MSILQKADPVGIDLGTFSLKAVQLKRSAGKVQLAKWDAEPTPEGAIDGGMIRDVELLGGKLADLLNRMELRKPKIITAIGGQQVFTRTLLMPVIPRSDMAAAIQFQLEGILPIPIQEAVIDFSVLGIQQTAEGERAEILIVATRKAIIEQLVAVCNRAQALILAIEIGPLALNRCLYPHHRPIELPAKIKDGWLARWKRGKTASLLRAESGRFQVRKAAVTATSVPAVENQLSAEDENQYPEAAGSIAGKGVLYLNLGHNSVQFSLFQDQVMRFTRTISHGGIRFISALAAERDLSMNEALELMRQGTSPASTETIMSDIIGEVWRSIEYFQQHNPGLTVAEVILTGGAARLSNWPDFLRERLPVPVNPLDPLQHIAVKSSPEEIRELQNSYGIALGLALREVI